MLKSLKLTNFQAHTSTKICFGSGITSIIGASDIGKSAVIRALGWCALNNLPGESFIRHKTKEAVVEIVTDGHRVTRSKARGGASNLYELDGDELKAFGMDVPAQVFEALRLSPINFQSQHDAPFWFGLSGGEVAKQINAIVDLSIIDQTLYKLGQEVRRRRDAVVVSAQRLKQLRERHESIKWVEGAAGELAALVKTESRVEKLRAQSTRIRAALSVRRERSSRIKELAAILQELGTLSREAKASQRAREILDSASNSMQNLAAQQTTLKKARSSAAASSSMSALVEAAQNAISARSRATSMAARLEALRESWKNTKQARKDFELFKIELERQCAGRCPVCGGAYHVHG